MQMDNMQIQLREPMKLTLAVLMLIAFTHSAFASQQNCRAIEGAKQRLACYDKASAALIDAPAVETDVPRAAYKDPFATEDARTTAKLKNICRGC
jgi:hypothetical protein